MTSKTSIDAVLKTVAKTPWLLGLLLGLPLLTICTVAIVLTFQGELDGEALANFGGMIATLVVPVLIKKRKQIPAEEKKP